MATPQTRNPTDIHPRRTGEIFDDAWRLTFAHASFLLALSGFFVVPFALLAVWLLCQPAANPIVGVVLPIVAAFLFFETGIGAGALQEAFHLWAENKRVSMSRCLRAAYARGMSHRAAQGVLWFLPGVCILIIMTPELPGVVQTICFVLALLLAVPILLWGMSHHAAIASGQYHVWKAWRASIKQCGRHPGRAFMILFGRWLVLGVAMLNAHLMLQFGLWVAEALGGFNVSAARFLLTFANPLYLLTLLWICWWLLSPYFEAVRYFAFIDARVRYEGLDLWFRVQKHFPRNTAKAGVILLSLAMFGMGDVVRGQSIQQSIPVARKEIEQIAKEAKSAKAYPGPQKWLPRLRRIGRLLDAEGNTQRGSLRWFYREVDRFANSNRRDGVAILDGLVNRLSVLEQSFPKTADDKQWSPDDLRKLIPPWTDSKQPEQLPKVKSKKIDDKVQENEKDRDDNRKGRDGVNFGGGGAGGPGLVGPISLGGIGNLLFILFLGVCAAILVVAVIMAICLLAGRKKPLVAQQRGKLANGDDLDQWQPENENADQLWRDADALARKGRFLDAVRALYLSVLVVLHQGRLIRFERTKTNGEYADQLRKKSELHKPFVDMTGLFEWKWFGEKHCDETDFMRCRDLANEIRHAV